MGYVSAAISTGFIIGPGAGGFIAGFGIRMPFFFASAIALIAAVTSVFILKESLSIEERHQLSSHTKESNFIKDLKRSIHPVYFIAFI
ncbi:MFS transporter, partial [Xanthomonas citri pv. citri]|nr:MFS transporter [Xanthomonas citri pv. citri]